MEDPFTQLSDKELEVGYWWTTHRIKIKAIFLIITITAIIGLYVNAGWRFYLYLSGTAVHEEMLVELTSSNLNYEQIRRLTGPTDLRVNNTYILASRAGSYDILAEVENVNQRWWLKQLNYQFAVDGELTEENSIFILPGEKKYLYYFNYHNASRPTKAKLIIKREVWHRIRDLSKLDARGKWQVPDLQVNELKYSPSIFRTGQSQVSFSLANNSPYSFWEVELQVLLWQGQRLVDFNVITLDSLLVGERRAVEVLMGRNLPSGLRPVVVVSANSLDETNLRSFGDNLPNIIR